MLAAGILSAAVGTSGGVMAPLMLTGAGVALGARLWHRRLHRAARRRDDLHDLGGYPLDMLRDPRFTSPHRP